MTTYQAGKVALVGFDGASNRVTLTSRSFDKPMGLASRDGELALATRTELVTLSTDDASTFRQRRTVHTGDVAMHDVAFGEDNRAGAPAVWFINTKYSTLGSVTTDGRVKHEWKPDFVTELLPEDRCHLNGLSMREGRPAHVTALGTTDRAGAWRGNRTNGGVLMDVKTGARVLENLCMPHSPRWFSPKDSGETEKLYFLNGGHGELCIMTDADVSRGVYSVVCALPGFTRGLAFMTSTFTGRAYAIVGLSHVRATHTFAGLPVQERWHGKLVAGAAVVDLTDGRHVATFEFVSGVTELYDVQFLAGVRTPTILPFKPVHAM